MAHSNTCERTWLARRPAQDRRLRGAQFCGDRACLRRSAPVSRPTCSAAPDSMGGWLAAIEEAQAERAATLAALGRRPHTPWRSEKPCPPAWRQGASTATQTDDRMKACRGRAVAVRDLVASVQCPEPNAQYERRQKELRLGQRKEKRGDIGGRKTY
jgi:hypothetical protein